MAPFKRMFICISHLDLVTLSTRTMFFSLNAHYTTSNRLHGLGIINLLFIPLGWVSHTVVLIHPFFYRFGQHTAYLLLYVDYIILTGSSTHLLQQIISRLSKEFSMTSLGPLNYFQGISATRNSTSLFLSQEKYATCILQRANMLQFNPCRTPVYTTHKQHADGKPVSDPTLYRSLAGALQYLTFTISDISSVVQQICLFMHDPIDPHLYALKHILRYIRGTIDYGIDIYVSPHSALTAYSDAEWGDVLYPIDLLMDTSFFLVITLSHGLLNSRDSYLVPVPKQNTEGLPMSLQRLVGFVISSWNFCLHPPKLPFSNATTSLQFICLLTRYNTCNAPIFR